MFIYLYDNIYSVVNVISDKLYDQIMIKKTNKKIERINDYNLFIRTCYHITAPFKGITYVCDNIYLGNAYNASNFNYLKSLDIKIIINATNEINNYFPNNFIYHKLNNLYDNNESNIKYILTII